MDLSGLRRWVTRIDQKNGVHITLVLLGCGLSILAGLPILVLFALGFYGFKRIGLDRPASWLIELRNGLLASLVIWLLARGVINPLSDLLGQALHAPPRPSLTEELRGHPGLYVEYLVLSVSTAGFLEEFLYRGYLMNRIGDWLSGPWRWPLASLAVSIPFGAAHFTNGLSGVLFAFLMSFLFCGAYLLLNKRLWPVMMAHALYDVTTISLAYLGWLPAINRWIGSFYGLA